MTRKDMTNSYERMFGVFHDSATTADFYDSFSTMLDAGWEPELSPDGGPYQNPYAAFEMARTFYRNRMLPPEVLFQCAHAIAEFCNIEGDINSVAACAADLIKYYGTKSRSEEA